MKISRKQLRAIILESMLQGQQVPEPAIVASVRKVTKNYVTF